MSYVPNFLTIIECLNLAKGHHSGDRMAYQCQIIFV